MEKGKLRPRKRALLRIPQICTEPELEPRTLVSTHRAPAHSLLASPGSTWSAYYLLSAPPLFPGGIFELKGDLFECECIRGGKKLTGPPSAGAGAQAKCRYLSAVGQRSGACGRQAPVLGGSEKSPCELGRAHNKGGTLSSGQKEVPRMNSAS